VDRSRLTRAARLSRPAGLTLPGAGRGPRAAAYIRTARRQLPLLALPIAPVQGLWVTRRVIRLAEADGVTGTVGSGERTMHVVVLGDSVAAGYAVAHHRETVAGALAQRLAERFGAQVTWSVRGVSGYTAGQALALVDAEVLAPADLVFVSIGVNDAKNGHSTRRFRAEVETLFDAVLAAAPEAAVCLLGIPPLDGFPLLPRPLADVLGWRGRVFDAIGRSVVAARPRMFRIEASGMLAPEMFAEDGFHPSVTLHAAFADAVMAGLEERLSRSGR
jgi:lysophospholipase L1-like esterase